MVKVNLILTPLGWMAAGYGNQGLIVLTLPTESQEKAIMDLQETIKKSIVPLVDKQVDLISGLSEEIRKYFAKENYCFDVELDYSLCSSFARSVYATVRGIPHGQTRSYGWVAKQLGKPFASRAVGEALGNNPFSLIVPCHRIITSTGTIGGFSAGVALKKKLMDHEGIVF